MYIVQNNEVAIVLRPNEQDENVVDTRIISASELTEDQENFLYGLVFHMMAVMHLTSSDVDSMIADRLSEIATSILSKEKLTETSEVAGSA